MRSILPGSEKADLPLVAHAGLERAVLGREAHDFGNPLRLRRALDAGVRVVVAHCASMGEDRDLDRGANGPYVESFSLFVRVFERYANCYGDVSAMTQVNRAGPALARVIEADAWHARLLNGSDYPLPGVMPIFSVDYLVSLKLLDGGSAGAARYPAAQPAPLRLRAEAQPARQRQASQRAYSRRANFS